MGTAIPRYTTIYNIKDIETLRADYGSDGSNNT